MKCDTRCVQDYSSPGVYWFMKIDANPGGPSSHDVYLEMIWLERWWPKSNEIYLHRNGMARW